MTRNKVHSALSIYFSFSFTLSYLHLVAIFELSIRVCHYSGTPISNERYYFVVVCFAAVVMTRDTTCPSVCRHPEINFNNSWWPPLGKKSFRNRWMRSVKNEKCSIARRCQDLGDLHTTTDNSLGCVQSQKGVDCPFRCGTYVSFGNYYYVFPHWCKCRILYIIFNIS